MPAEGHDVAAGQRRSFSASAARSLWSQTALRDVIGKTLRSDMLEGREKLGKELQQIIDERTEPWGINVISVEVKDVLIPPGQSIKSPKRADKELCARSRSRSDEPHRTAAWPSTDVPFERMGSA